MTLTLDALGVDAWVDGNPVDVRNNRIELDAPSAGICQVALRVKQKPGYYGGAALPQPVCFKCSPTRMPLGDWCDHALESYSGGAVYRKSFKLEPHHLDHRIFLDLGQVHCTAQIRINEMHASVCIAPPNRVDVTEQVRKGENLIEITVFNTLANHYDVGFPSRFVYPGQTVSGLLGPVTLLFMTQVDMIAKPCIM